MAAPPPRFLNQVTDTLAPNNRTDCGEFTAAMALEAVGIMDTPEEEITDLGHSGVTYAPELSKLLTDNGATVTPIAAAALRDALADGKAYALLLIRDNNNGDPDVNGPYTHWILSFRDNPDFTVQCANPWGGRDVAYPTAQLVAAIVWAASIRWPAVAPAAPVIAVSEEVIDVAAVQMWDRHSAPWQGNQVWAYVNAAGELRQRWATPGVASSAAAATIATGARPNADVAMRIDSDAETVHLNVPAAAGGVLHLYGNKGAPWGLEHFA